ncbi:MAG: PAS domain S-box protein [Bacteroidia bacterium]
MKGEMNDQFSVTIDEQERIIAINAFPDYLQIATENLIGKFYSGEQNIIDENCLWGIGTSGVYFANSHAVYFFRLGEQRISNNKKTIVLHRAPVLPSDDKDLLQLLEEFKRSNSHIKAPAAFLSKNAKIAWINQPFEQFFVAQNQSEKHLAIVEREIKKIKTKFYPLLFKTWDIGFSNQLILDEGLLAGRIMASPIWTELDQFAGFRIEFQPRTMLSKVGVNDTLAALPLHNPNPVLKLDKNYKLLFANDAARLLLQIEKSLDDSEQGKSLIHSLLTKGLENPVFECEIQQQIFEINSVQTPKEILLYFHDITISNTIKISSKLAYAQLEAIVNASRGSIILLDTERKILFYNDKSRKDLRKYFGMELETNAPLPDFFDKNFNYSIDTAITTVLAGKHKLNYEIDYDDVSGKKLWFSILVYPISIKNEELTGVCVSMLNVTDTKNAQLENQNIKNFYESVLNNIPTDVAVFDKDHRYLFLNPHAIKDDHLRSWMIGKTDYDYVDFRKLDSSIADKRRGMFTQVVKQQEKLAFVDEHTTQNRTRFIYRNYYPVIEKGEVKLVIGYGLDITDIKESEQRVRQSETRLKGLFDNNPLALILVSSELLITEMNVAAHKIWSNNPIGSSIINYIESRDQNAFIEFIHEAFLLNFNENKSFKCEIELNHKKLFFDFSASPVIAEDNSKVLMLAAYDRTEQVVSAELLRQSEEFNRNLIKNMPIPFAIIDWDKAVFLNDACKALIGADENIDLNSQSLFDFVEESDRMIIAERLQKRYAGEYTPPGIIRINTLKGEQKNIEIQGGLLQNGENVLNFVTFIDRTEEIKAAKAQKNAEEQTRQIIDTSLDCIITTNSNGEIIGWNPKSEEVFGYAFEEVTGKNIAKTIVPHELSDDFLKALRNPKQQLLPIGKVFEWQAIRKSGEIFPVELFITIQRTQKFHFFTAIIRDISERKAAEQSRIESEQKLSLLIESLPVVPYSQVGANLYQFNYINERVFNLIGYSADDLMLQPDLWIKQIYPSDLPAIYAAMGQLNSSSEGTVEYRIKDAKSSTLWIRDTFKRIRNENNEIVSWTGVIQDITAERETKERQRLIEATLVEISREELSATKSLYGFYQTVYKRLKKNLGIAGFSIWRVEESVYRTVESFHELDEMAAERSSIRAAKEKIQPLLGQAGIQATDSTSENYALNEVFDISKNTSLLVSKVRSSLDEDLIMLIEVENVPFSWQYEHFNMINALSELVSFNLEYFQRIESDNKLREAFRLAKIGAWEIEPEKNRIYWSEAMFEFYGLNTQNQSPLSFDDALEFIHHADREAFSEAFYNLKNNNIPYRMECRHVLNDGTVKYFEKSALPIQSATGNVLFMGVTVDITDRKLAQREYELRQRRRIITNAVGSAIASSTSLSELFVKFSDAIIQNSPARQVLVFSDEKNSGIFSEYYSYPATSHAPSGLNASINKQINDDLFIAPLNAAAYYGADFPDWIVAPIQMPGRGRCYMVVRLNDAEEINEDFLSIASATIRLVHEKAEQIYSDETLKTLNTELMDSNLQLRQYSYIVSHNLRAPVANILGCINLLGDEVLQDPKNSMLFEGLKISARNVDSILQDLNKILNIKEDVVKQFEALDFQQILNEVMESIKHESKDVDYVLSANFNAIKGMRAFKPYLVSIFQNLLINSIKYRRSNTILQLGVESKLTDGKIQLLFSDNGRGIDLAKNKKRLFKLYERFHSDVAGTGLGLNMVQEQARVMGGTIQIESEVEKGTQFIITFVPKE